MLSAFCGTCENHLVSVLRMGSWAAGAVSVIGVAYVVALGFGFARSGFDEPIVDPVLAVMEVLTLLSATAMVVAMAAVQAYASAERKVLGTLALAFTVLFAGTTSTVHFVELTASRQLGAGGIVWPSATYAAELLAWDWFLGLALMAAAPVFCGAARERFIRRGLWLSGILTFAGTIGPAVGDMRLQRIGILGYAVVLPVVFFILARLFSERRREAPGA
jgi:hypothetical protein